MKDCLDSDGGLTSSSAHPLTGLQGPAPSHLESRESTSRLQGPGGCASLKARGRRPQSLSSDILVVLRRPLLPCPEVRTHSGSVSW